MFEKILISNRGEIAVRIMKTCRRMGIRTAAVYSDVDAQSLHKMQADEALYLGGAKSRESYLRMERILELALSCHCEAIHPGYGFLSENADFAQAVIDAGLTWIGPPPQAIRSLGDKVSARHIAQRAGAPQVPGTADPVTGADEVVAFASEHGLPVAIKAAFGGGGRGLKVARTLEEIPDLYDSAVREAVAAFGRGECFVERYLDNPRHVETQVLGDTHGNVVVVSTRDCSLQRRHQKLVEEAPAPFLTDDQLARLYASSKAIIKEAGYYNAGTCEFLVGMDGTISFLEVNTRLQVEHPVTESVTGLDLVEWQLRVAAGESLPCRQDELGISGHAIEVRVYAEDPARDFLPSIGPLRHLRQPQESAHVRVDTGVRQGDEVSMHYDPMIAKLIVWDHDRKRTVRRLQQALADHVTDSP